MSFLLIGISCSFLSDIKRGWMYSYYEINYPSHPGFLTGPKGATDTDTL